ncbi:MAG: hypothetical protein VX080_07015, partial [SAR324 cluster bacterium]|nr:hypothetical protein [SAR324 cluster bacterium]
MTFGASGAPGRGDADYDGLGADFQIDSGNGPGSAGSAGIRKIDENQMPEPKSQRFGKLQKSPKLIYI